ncbi:uncharacterized protein PAN0_010d4104 [Moesziomyces antarcticus]|uniref:Uncharacterized protein n=2 Tax=Pseudozyma antarctica TaxID=84753 RepID=A0A081CGT6_PSEA2|nr:uncharacterized protein PAN0_010d4104 [Moesziomyces antarcticus]GAK65882.1 conserved hypothetical protein [Moesziomyces antarcticus]
MDASLGTALIASPGACSDPFSLTPELIRSQSMAGESDDDSAHPTPSAMTPAATSCPSESWPTAKTRSDPPHRAEDEVRKIHYIDSPAQTIAPQAGLPSATIPTAVAPSQASAAAAGSEPPAATALAAIPSAPAPDQAQSAAAAPVAAQSIATAPSSAASTPASTPAAAPQTFARKRGRPRKHPLPDPNNPPPPKPKRKRSADADSASLQSKATAAAAAASARSAASNTGSLLSVPDLGRLIPQGSSSDNAQDFIKNNLRLFADLFVALQKQAITDGSGRDEPSIEASHPAPTVPLPASGTSTESHASAQTGSASSSTTLPSGAAAPRTSISAPSDGLRDEIKKKMADVTKGREAIQAEMLQMRVDASFFENAQKTVDERIIILRDRIAKHTATLQREREATRQAREASRQAKKHRKAKQKGLRDSEREERRLAQTFMQLEREIAAEEEERRRLEQAESSADEDDDGDGDGEARTDAAPDSATAGQTHWDTLEQLRALDPAIITASPSEATSMSATATPSVSNDTPSAQDRAIGFSDEELAKVLGISTTELAGFSQTLDIPSFQPAAHDQGSAQHGSLLGIPAAHSDQPADSTDGASQDAFDVAAFLEMASSLGAVASTDAAQPSSGDAS